MLIRPFRPEDLTDLIAVQNAAVPLRPLGASELEHDLHKLEPHLRRTILVAELNGRVVGASDHHRSAGSYDPQRFHLELYVHPESRGQGIGAALFDATLEAVRAQGAISVRTQVSEDEPAAVRFAQARGFNETKRDFESSLGLSGFDAAPYATLLDELEARGVQLESWRAVDSSGFRRQLHATFSEVRLDVPRAEPPSPIKFDFFEANVLNDADLIWDASFVALEGDALLGFTGAYRSARGGWVDQWLTATTREARGRGIATALKVKQLEVLRRLGFTHVRTDNDSRNVTMIAVNTKLGFVRGPAVLSVVKAL
jgi:GNAT superfamily N-acetyltransferase